MIVGLLAAAAAQIADPIEDACYKRDVSQQAMNRCAGEAYQRADAALNATYSNVLRVHDDREGRRLLRDAQRAWIKYRDGHCTLEALDSRGGSIWPLINSGCLAELTRQRTKELADLIAGASE